MQRLLKLVQNRSNSFDYQAQNLGIFDIHTYQKAIDRMSCSSSLEHIVNKTKRLSVSEVPKYQSNALFHGTQIVLKQEIKPHETRQIASRITQIIKTKREVSKFLSGEPRGNDRMISSLGKEKKASYSAYINARKKIFDRQTSSHINHSTNAHSQPKQAHPKKQSLYEEDKNSESFATDYLNRQLQSEFEIHTQNGTNYMSNTINKYQRIRLEGLVTNKKIELKPESKDPNKAEIDMRASNLRKGFITVIKKRANDSHLMVKSTKRASQRKVDQGEVVQDFSKHFVNQKNLMEDDIELYPFVDQIIKLGKGSENAYNLLELNSKSVTILHHSDEITKNIFSINEKERVEIASITKIMTCYLILIIAERFCIDIKKEKLIVSERASKMPGTSAKLAYSDMLTVYDILHGLMLPSGNDAAISLGQWGGKQIKKYSSLLRRMRISNEAEETQDKSSNFLVAFSIKRKSQLKLFIHHMNKLAKYLHLNSTHFVNTHGLMNEKAYSCSQNIALLTHYAMKNRIFRQIVGKQTYQCKLFNRTFSHSKEIFWQNTNKLLNIQGFLGVKTGITPSAGPCLTSLFQISPSEYFIITILKTRSCEMRFKQTINLLKATLHFIEVQPYHYSYQKAIQNLQKYDRLDLKQDEKEFLNNCRESTQSNQSNEEREDEDFNEMRQVDVDGGP